MVQLNGKSPVTRLAATVCPVKVRYYHKNPFFLCAVKYKLAISPMGCCPRGSNVLCVSDRFPHSEIALGKNSHDSSPRRFYGLKNPKRLNQSRESEMYQTVEITCCFCVEFIRTRKRTQSAKTQQNFERSCKCF